MTIQGWVLFGILALFILSFGIFGAIIFEKIVWKVLGIVAAVIALNVNFPSVLCNDLTIRRVNRHRPFEPIVQFAFLVGHCPLTAGGILIIPAHPGKESDDEEHGGYVLFDYEGKRYTYYNCFVESIADIK